MDITETLAPTSDQMDYEDVMAAERTFTIKGVRMVASKEQPVEIDLEEFDRPWRPGKTMRRVLAMAWGADASKYAGKQVRLFGDPTVKWAGQAVGGIRIRALSDLDGPLTVAVTVGRGKRAPYVVQPLEMPKDTSGRDWLVELTDTQGDPTAIKALGTAARAAHASETTIKVILAAYRDANNAEHAELDQETGK